jgi:hypothetical protein
MGDDRGLVPPNHRRERFRDLAGGTAEPDAVALQPQRDAATV